MTKVSNVSSPKEVVLGGAVQLNAGQLYVNADTNGAVVCPTTQTAAAFATAIGASGIKSIDLGARSGAFWDTGKPIFDV